MLVPTIVKINPITMIVVAQLMTWIALMARFAIFEFTRFSPDTGKGIFEAVRSD